jgi:general secretion pathway protein F
VASFRYRAVAAGGAARTGVIEATDARAALLQLRRQGETPLEVAEVRGAAAQPRRGRVSGASRRAAAKLVAELGVLLNAGLPTDRALALALDNVDQPAALARLLPMLPKVREGVPLSRALAETEGLFPPMAQAMVEAGEANGRLGDALARLGDTLDRAEALRQLIVSSSIYPVALLVIAVGVILLMLLFVVPQFETVFANSPTAKLPAASLAVMDASRFLRSYGLMMIGVLALAILPLRQLFRSPAIRQRWDRLVLRLPQLGPVVSYSQTAQFTRTLAVLIEGGVDLPQALGTARRSLSNSAIAEAVGRVAAEVKEGGGLSGPLAATGMFPRLALGFFRTGEETSRLGPMLDRLADVLEAEVRLRLSRLIAVLTPAITVILGGIVATIIASIMTAILGFNDLAVG